MAQIGFSGSSNKTLKYGGLNNTLDIVLRYASRSTKDYRMLDESISQ